MAFWRYVARNSISSKTETVDVTSIYHFPVCLFLYYYFPWQIQSAIELFSLQCLPELIAKYLIIWFLQDLPCASATGGLAAGRIFMDVTSTAQWCQKQCVLTRCFCHKLQKQHVLTRQQYSKTFHKKRKCHIFLCNNSNLIPKLTHRCRNSSYSFSWDIFRNHAVFFPFFFFSFFSFLFQHFLSFHRTPWTSMGMVSII